jgi:hypothetical protein
MTWELTMSVSFDEETRRRLEQLDFTITGPGEAVAQPATTVTVPIVEEAVTVSEQTSTTWVYPLWFIAERLLFPQGIFRVTCKKYIDPKIAFDIYPMTARNVVFRISCLCIEGDLDVELRNTGEDGKEGRKTISRLQYMLKGCPTDPNEYNWRTVTGSATLKDNSALHDFWENQTGAYLSRLSHRPPNVAVGQSVRVTGRFRTGGLGNLFWTLLQIFLRGTVTLRNGFDVTVHYDWLGKRREVKRRVDVRVTVPVEGSISVAW